MRYNRLLPFLLLFFSLLALGWILLNPFWFQQSLIFFRSERTIVDSTLPLHLKWTAHLPESAAYFPIYANNLVLFRTGSSLFACRADTGELVWEVDAGTLFAPPLPLGTTNDAVLFSTNRQTSLVAVASDNGHTLWQQGPTNVFQNFFTPTIQRLLINQPSHLVYSARTRYPILQADNTSSGESVWNFNHGSGDGFSTFFLQDERLYVFWSDDLFILDASTGKLQDRIPDRFSNATALALSGANVLMSYKGGLTAKDLKTGDMQWEFNVDCGVDTNPLLPNVTNNLIYVTGSCDQIYALEPTTGKLLWKQALEANAYSPMVVIEANGYSMLSNGSVIAFDLQTGTIQGLLHTNPAQTSPLLYASGLATDGRYLFVNFGDRTIFAFGP